MTASWPEAINRLARAIGEADLSRSALAGASGFVPTEALILGDGFSFANTQIAPNEAAYKSGIQQFRAGLASATQNIRAATDAALAEMALALGYSGLAGASALPWIYQSMATNKNSAGAAFATGNSFVQSRNITRGAPTTTGTGNGVLTRLAIDRYGFTMEADTPEAILMTCRQDVTLGTNPGQEAFDCYAAGAPAGDVFQIWTSGIGDGLQAPSGAVIGVTADTTASLGVQNPSFASGSGTGANFVLNGWTLSAGLASQLSISTLTADIYRSSALEGTTPGALKVTFSGATTTVAAGSNGVNVNTFAGAGVLNVASTTGFPASGSLTVNTGSGYVTITYTGTAGGNQFTGCSTTGSGVLSTGGYVGQNQTVTITQTISTNGGALDATRAYFSRLACNRSNYTGVATVTTQIGSRSWSLFLNSQSGYQGLSPALSSATDATNGPNLWFQNFDTNSFSVTITVSIGLGSILIDDLTWGPFTSVANKLYWLGGGSTNFLYLDTITFTDSEPLGGSLVGITNRWLARLYGVWNFPAQIQPAVPASAPTAATGAAGVVTAGTHYFAISYFNNSTGIEGPPGPVSTVYVASGTTQVSLSAIPTSGALFRKVYMTKAGGNPLELNFVGSINDNSTTTFNVNTADGSLTAFSPATADV